MIGTDNSLSRQLLTLFFAAFLLLPGRALADSGTIAELGYFSDRPFDRLSPIAVNSGGVVAGTSTGQVPFVWSESGGLRRLTSITDGTGTVTALNNSNLVFGSASNPATSRQDLFRSIVDGATTFLNLNNTVTNGNGTHTTNIYSSISANNNGLVVGVLDSVSDDPSCPVLCNRFSCLPTCPHSYQLFSVFNGQLTPYPVTASTQSLSTILVNDSGLVIFTGYDGTTMKFTSYRGTVGSNFSDLAPITKLPYVSALNNSGQYVGAYQRTSGNSFPYAGVVVNADGTTVDLTASGTVTEVPALTISNNGIVVGQYRQDGGNGTGVFIWSPARGLRDLSQYLPASSGWTLRTATAINDSSWVVGEGQHNGVDQAYQLKLPAVDPDGTAITPTPLANRLTRAVSLSGSCGPKYVLKHGKLKKKSGVLACDLTAQATGLDGILIPQRLITLVEYVTDKKGRVKKSVSVGQGSSDTNGQVAFHVDVKDKSFLLFASVVDRTDFPPYGRQSATVSGRR